MKKYSKEAKELLSSAELFEIKAGSSERTAPDQPTCKFVCTSCTACTTCTVCTTEVGGGSGNIGGNPIS